MKKKLKLKAHKKKLELLFFVTVINFSCYFQNPASPSFFKFSFFGSPTSSCKKIHKKVSKKQKLSKRQKQKLIKQAEACLIKGEVKTSLLLFKKLLFESKKQNLSLKEIQKWQKKIADISFYQLKNYEQALKYYTKLLKSVYLPSEKFLIQYHVAESFFYLKKYNQALRELEKCFFEGILAKQEKEINLLKARIFIAKKEFSKGLDFLQKQINKFPEQESLFREYRALIYEEKKDLFLAIKELEKIQPSNAFIKRKIHALVDRQNNQPGF